MKWKELGVDIQINKNLHQKYQFSSEIKLLLNCRKNVSVKTLFQKSDIERTHFEIPSVSPYLVQKTWLHHCERHQNRANDSFSPFPLTTL